MNYEKPEVLVLSLGVSAVRGQAGANDSNGGGRSDGKAQVRTETGNDGAHDFNTSTTAAAYEADE